MCLYIPRLSAVDELVAYKIVHKNREGKYESVYITSKPTVFEKIQEIHFPENKYNERFCYHATRKYEYSLSTLETARFFNYANVFRIQHDLLIVKVRLFGTIFYDGFDDEVAATGIEFLEEISDVSSFHIFV